MNPVIIILSQFRDFFWFFWNFSIFVSFLDIFGQKMLKNEKKSHQIFSYPRIYNVACVILSHHPGLCDLRVRHSKIFDDFLVILCHFWSKSFSEKSKKNVKKMLIPSNLRGCVCHFKPSTRSLRLKMRLAFEHFRLFGNFEPFMVKKSLKNKKLKQCFHYQFSTT